MLRARYGANFRDRFSMLATACHYEARTTLKPRQQKQQTNAALSSNKIYLNSHHSRSNNRFALQLSCENSHPSDDTVPHIQQKTIGRGNCRRAVIAPITIAVSGKYRM